MKLYEFCKIYNIECQLEAQDYGYSFGLVDFKGCVWGELEHVDGLEGGTTWTCGKGETPSEAVHNFCKFIEGRLLVFEDRDKIRCPNILEI